MQFFILFFTSIFIKYSVSNYIQCTPTYPQITISFQQPLTIPIDNQDSISNYVSALVCVIEYRIDYDTKQIYVNFKATNDTNRLKENHSEFLSQALWLSFNKESQQPNIAHRKYECNTKDDCARSFYLNTIEHLITVGISKLDEIHMILYSPSNPKPRRCRDNSKPKNQSLVRCGKGLCYAHTIDQKQYCAKDNTPILFSEFQYYLPKLITNERELIEYKCNINLCNKNATIDQIKNILIDYTNWNIDYIESKKSSTIQQNLSYYLFLFSLINLKFLF